VTQENRPRTGAEALVRRLRDQGVRHVFGYPGGQITPLYDALYREPAIRHILARDEQAAAFMADGYARATGRPGVAVVVCGPGVLNAATPLATAFTDSVPLLLISGQVASQGRGPRSGYYHENDQLSACATITKWRARAEDVGAVVSEFDRAFAAVAEQRPGTALFEIPVDILRAEYPNQPLPPLPAAAAPLMPAHRDIETLAGLVAGWHKPLLLAGGGVISAGAEPWLLQLAERIGSPVFHTLNGKSAFPADHPMAARLPWDRATSDLSNMEQFMSPLFAQADGLLAIGCRFTQAATGSWTLRLPPSVAQIDIDAAEIGRHYPVHLGIHADARETLRALLEDLAQAPRKPWVRPPPPREPARLQGLDLLAPLRRALPRDAIIAADITRLSYILLAEFPVYEPRTFLHPAGFVPMGYGLPAALGAKVAFPERTVVAVVGDGCFLMSGMELASAVQEKLAIVVVLINDDSLSLIKAIQHRRYENRFIGVDLRNPDFGLFARAFGVRSWSVATDDEFATALQHAVALKESALIEVRLNQAQGR
jgi:acetolactate synthase-1/2/3 large subunit